jgi:four helix bundle protein
VPTIRKFEDLNAWKKARELTKSVYRLTHENRFNHDFGLRDQIRRAGSSIMLNIAEGFARQTDKEFAQFLTHAHGSLAEVQSGLYIALDQGYIVLNDFKKEYVKCEEISRMIQVLSKYLRKSN